MRREGPVSLPLTRKQNGAPRRLAAGLRRAYDGRSDYSALMASTGHSLVHRSQSVQVSGSIT